MLSVREMRQLIATNHYTRSLPSGDSVFTQFENAVLVFSRPANKNISRWLLGGDNLVWELSRMWAPDGHRPNLLTQAIPICIKQFQLTLVREGVPIPEALISFADPNAGHSGRVYIAASWVFLGESEETRLYRDPEGKLVSRRSFHAGPVGMKKADIEALGFVELRRPGKRRFAKGLNRWARGKIQNHAARPTDETVPTVVSAVQPRGAAPFGRAAE